MLSINQVSLSQGNKCLLKNANLIVYPKQKIGLIGHNGCGKSSLFSLFLNQLTPDAGECMLNSGLRLSYLAQHLPDSEQSALDYVLAGDEDYHTVLQQLAQAEAIGDDHAVLACHERLVQLNGYAIPAMAASILAGLGFSAPEQQLPVNHFSGGWRMRLNLARCLMKPADLLLLDEPTNHLDLEAIIWLEKWLKQTPSSVIVISHDRDFLDEFVNHIVHIEQQSLHLYTGNYSRFEILRAQQLALQQATYEKQQDKIKHMQAFVNRFRAKATKAKQAQSRLRAIDKMELVVKAQIDSPFSFQFYPCTRIGKPLLKTEQMNCGYHQDKVVLKNVNLTINPGDRLALLGANGQGKSTLVKTLMNSLAPLAGQLNLATNLKVAYFAQHQGEQFDAHLSPLEILQALTPQTKEQTIRQFLGGFNFIDDTVTQSIKHFSGGEKARLALAKLVWLQPHLLVLDEPTNHLDLNMRQALELALLSYEGALILISHDRHLVRSCVDHFYLINDHKLTYFDGDIDDYYQWLQQSKLIPRTTNITNANSQFRQQRSIQNRLKRLDQLMTDYQQQLQQLEAQLADVELYTEHNQTKLQQILQKQTLTAAALQEAEEEWLELSS